MFFSGGSQGICQTMLLVMDSDRPMGPGHDRYKMKPLIAPLFLRPYNRAGVTGVKTKKPIWGFPKMVGFPQQTHGVCPTQNDQHLGWPLGVPPFKETPICGVISTTQVHSM